MKLLFLLSATTTSFFPQTTSQANTNTTLDVQVEENTFAFASCASENVTDGITCDERCQQAASGMPYDFQGSWGESIKKCICIAIAPNKDLFTYCGRPPLPPFNGVLPSCTDLAISGQDKCDLYCRDEDKEDYPQFSAVGFGVSCMCSTGAGCVDPSSSSSNSNSSSNSSSNDTSSSNSNKLREVLLGLAEAVAAAAATAAATAAFRNYCE